ncbi:hypothetical protein V8F33_005677 [Rhypophila sp. PSN 637]
MDRAKRAFKWAKENPLTAASGVAAAGGATVVVAPALVTAPALGFMGFGSSGVAAGSFAAGVQATIGNVVGGSLFATLTSAGMGGYGAATVAAAGQVVGGIVAGAGAAGVLAGKIGNQARRLILTGRTKWRRINWRSKMTERRMAKAQAKLRMMKMTRMTKKVAEMNRADWIIGSRIKSKL